MKIIYAVSSLGLGHASRSLIIIKTLAKKNEIILVSNGNALKLLKEELVQYDNIKFLELQDYPPILRGRGGTLYYYYLMQDCLKILFLIIKEYFFVNKLLKEQKTDLIFSDCRYGFHSKEIPSVLLTHMPRFLVPKELSFLQKVLDQFSKIIFSKFNLILIPDFEDKDKNLSGELSHNNILKNLPHKYIGILSAYKKKKTKKDIDYYFITSGYLKENKEEFIKRLIEKTKKLKGKKVLILGENEKFYKKIDKRNNLEIYSFVSGKLKNDLMNRSKIVFSRTGYTTIMDLIELDKKGILNPTPNQTEQEYLAKYLDLKGYFLNLDFSNDFDLEKITKWNNSKVFKTSKKTKDSLILIENLLNELVKKQNQY